MSLRLPQPAPRFRPFAPLPLALLAVALPAASLVLAAWCFQLLLEVLGQESLAEVTAHLRDGSLVGPPVEAALAASNMIFELLLGGLTVAVAWARQGATPERMLAWSAWTKDRSFLPFLGLMVAWQLIESLLIEPRFPELGALETLPSSQPALSLSLVNAAVLGPIAEELFFRGFLYTNLRAHTGFVPTIILTSLMFAALHFDASPVLAAVVLPFGLIAGLARERYGSVRPAIYLSAIWNLIAWGTQYF